MLLCIILVRGDFNRNGVIKKSFSYVVFQLSPWIHAANFRGVTSISPLNPIESRSVSRLFEVFPRDCLLPTHVLYLCLSMYLCLQQPPNSLTLRMHCTLTL